jgi:hypothetical protein
MDRDVNISLFKFEVTGRHRDYVCRLRRLGCAFDDSKDSTPESAPA